MMRDAIRTPVVSAVLSAQLRDVMRNPWIIGYAVLVALLTEAMFRMGGSGARALTGLLNLVLLLVPLVASVFGVVYWHAAREFTELLLAQPVPRRRLWWGLYLGLVLPLTAAFAAGLVVPLLLHRVVDGGTLALLALYVAVGAALTAVFGAVALWIGVSSTDRLRALGLMLGAWFLAAIAYDAFVVWMATAFSDWPLERPMLALMLANPIDLGRTVLVLRLDSAALLGYTGAVLARALGGPLGMLMAGSAMLAWIALPVWAAQRTFVRKDF